MFLDLLAKVTVENQPVSHNNRAGNYAPKLFASRPEQERFQVRDFELAMQRLFASGAIQNVAYGRKHDERTRIAAHRVALPAGGAHHLIDRRPLGSTQHRNHRVLFRRALHVGLRFRLRQGLDRRPELVDQCLAVADLSPLLAGSCRCIRLPMAIGGAGEEQNAALARAVIGGLEI